MRLDYTFFAIGAEVSAEGRLHVFGGEIGGMGFPDFPAAPMTLTLVVKLLASPDEVGLDRIVSLTYRLRGENQPIRHRQEVVVRPGANRMDEQAESGVIIIAMMGVLFEQPGIYEFGIETGNEVLRTVPFYVSEAQPNANEAARLHANVARN